MGLGDGNYYRIDKQQVLLYSTGNYIQYPVINHNGKLYEKIYMHTHIYLYVKLSHFAIQQKLSNTVNQIQ